MWELYQPFKNVAEVIKKTGSGSKAIRSLVVRRFLVHIGLSAGTDNKNFRHGDRKKIL